ncbi:MAG: hypothetical protein HC830_03925, partial [Bacteroidetes bacterium]|nr:hypothetical protein [Bacteroidota bacterium]
GIVSYSKEIHYFPGFYFLACSVYLFVIIRTDVNNTYNTENKKLGTKLKIAQLNVLYENTSYDSIINVVNKLNPGIVSLQEVNGRHTHSFINNLAEKYKYHIIENSSTDFNLFLFSQYPFINQEIAYFQGNNRNIPYFICSVKIESQVVTIICLHTSAPLNDLELSLRNQQLVSIAGLASKSATPLIIVGDLNAVPWSPEIVNLKKTANVRDSRNNFSVTFPANSLLAMFPIDYILHSADILCKEFKVFDIYGSDHLGVHGEYYLNKSIEYQTRNDGI